MRIVTAFVLAAASAGSAAFVLSQDHWALADRFLYGDKSAVAAPASLPAPSAAAAQSQIARVFSSSQPLLKDAKSPVAAPNVPLNSGITTAPANTASTPTPAASAINPAAITSATADPTVRRLASSRPADEDARQALVKDLQRELKRVGCFEGEVTGAWGASSKKAMAAFTDRVNATLPLDEPDYILLTLVQGHSDRACGMGCPGGQALNDGGKCVPRAVLAHAPRREAEPSPVVASRTDKPTSQPKQAARTQPPVPAKVASAWSTVVTAPAAKALETPARTAATPLPGRMAIGAPTDTADSASERATTEGITRKAALAAAAALALQRDADAETERKKRLTEAQARKNRELALQQSAVADANKNNSKPTTATSSKQPMAIAALVAPAATSPATPAAIDETAAVIAPARPVTRAPAQRTNTNASEFAQPAARIAVAPVRVPAPRLPPPYAIGRVVTVAPRPNYAPQPTRWTRTIFNDINRMR